MPGTRLEGDFVITDIPARLDRLPWSRWHTVVVIALGITWLLDGLEGTLAGALAGILKMPQALGFSDAEIGLSSTIYLLGAVVGALVFGYATDRLGRKKLFSVTLILYLSATAATAFSWNFASFSFFRALTGAGIGGEYSAINSAVDELIPARVRGHVDLLINSTFWIGSALGSFASLIVLKPGLFPIDIGWRFAFGIGAAIGLIILFMRRHVPESPRWLLIHRDPRDADKIVSDIERDVAENPGALPPPCTEICLRTHHHTPIREIWHVMAHQHRSRSILGFSLMVTQAFFYNAVLFTFGLVLLRYYNAPPARLGLFMVPLSIGNLFGPILMGRWFDTIGRRKMISGTYILSGLLLTIASWLFLKDELTIVTQVIAWSVVFFVASAAASSAYLTVSEVFPLEIRGFAIAVFYACGTFAGGVFGPALYGYIVGTGSRTMLFWGYMAGAVLMIAGGLIEVWLGVDAERQSLESIAAPLSAAPQRQVVE
jgi:MFS family permease